MMTLPRGLNARLEEAAEKNGRVTVIGDTGADSLSWSEVHVRSEHGASWLTNRDTRSGSSILLVGRTSLDMIIAIRAAWMAGASVTVATPPSRSQSESVLRQRFGLIRRSIGPSLILGDGDHLAKMISLTEPNVWEFTSWMQACERESTLGMDSKSEIVGDTLAVIQLTSGTTGTPKAVRVSRECLDANQAAITRGIALSDDDVFVSWLPLSHDMGLIGTLGIPMVSGVDLIVADPTMFVSRPKNWMEWCAQYGATITCAPNSTYGIAGSLLNHGSRIDLSRLRLAINGSESIDVDIFEGFLKAGEANGLAPQAAFPVYGLAEATLAVTFPHPGSGLQSDWFRDKYPGTSGAVPLGKDTAHSRRLAKVGSPVEGMAVDIVLEGQSLPDREIGEIHIRGSSVTQGYVGDPDSYLGTWLPTGDLGYTVNGELVVCGRSTDLVIIAGRNIYPEDVEGAVGRIQGVWRNNVAAFGVTKGDREWLIIVAESEVADRLSLARSISAAVRDWSDVSVADVCITEPRSLPKTSSGKISRSRARDLYVRGEL
jgi:fatty-acyl-CoA synthase